MRSSLVCALSVVHFLTAGHLLLAGLSPSTDEQQYAQYALEQSIVATESVASLDIEFTIVAKASDPAFDDPLTEVDSLGRPIRSFIHLWWDARGLQRLDVREWQPPDNRKHLAGQAYDHYGFTCDGQWYRGLNYLSNRARIGADAGEGRNYVTPLTLMGYGVYGVSGNICRFVSEHGRNMAFEQLDDGRVRLAAEYTPTYGTVDHGLLMTLDPKQDYLPVEILTRYLWSDTPDQEIRVSRTEVIDGVRVATAGTVASFAIELVYPDGLTTGEVNALSKEEYFERIAPRTIRRAVPVGDMWEAEFDASKIRVNDIQDLSFFSLEIPEDADLLDLSGRLRSAPKSTTPVDQQEQMVPIAAPVPNRTSGFRDGWVALIVVNAVVIAGLLVRFAWRWLKERSRTALVRKSEP